MNKRLKCKKTISGKHIWTKSAWDILTGEMSGSIKYKFPYKYNRCLACSMVDDRKLKVKES